MVETELELIPRCFWNQLDDNPGDFTLLAVISDYCREQGDEEAAECLRWCLEKRRVPNTFGWWLRDSESLSKDRRYTSGMVLPKTLYDRAGWYSISWGITGCGTADNYNRLIIKWRQTTENERAELWEWNPAV